MHVRSENPGTVLTPDLPAVLSPQWNPAPRQPHLGPGSLHLWWLPQLPPTAADPGLLQAEERARLARLSLPAMRNAYLQRRLLLRGILSQYLGITPAQLRLDIPEQGKPAVANAAGELDFNLTHSGGLTLLAVARGMRVGVDLERVRPQPRAAQVAGRIFGPDARFADDTAFLQAWTTFEARQKCFGQGIFGQRIAPDRTACLLLRPDPASIASLCWEPPSIRPDLHCYLAPADPPSRYHEARSQRGRQED